MSAPLQPLPAAAESEGPAPAKDRLLAAAATLLAERGFDAVSIRAVTRAAGLSVSAAHYHFGSKEALVREALRRHVEPLNARRLERLAALEEAGAPSLEAIVGAFLAPALELSASADPAARTYRRLPDALHTAPPEVTRELFQELFGEVVARFEAALARALPDRDLVALPLALQLGIGAMLHAIAGRAERLLGLDARAEPELLRTSLVRFVSDGILACCPPRPAAGRDAGARP